MITHLVSFILYQLKLMHAYVVHSHACIHHSLTHAFTGHALTHACIRQSLTYTEMNTHGKTL